MLSENKTLCRLNYRYEFHRYEPSSGRPLAVCDAAGHTHKNPAYLVELDAATPPADGQASIGAQFQLADQRAQALAVAEWHPIGLCHQPGERNAILLAELPLHNFADQEIGHLAFVAVELDDWGNPLQSVTVNLDFVAESDLLFVMRDGHHLYRVLTMLPVPGSSLEMFMHDMATAGGSPS